MEIAPFEYLARLICRAGINFDNALRGLRGGVSSRGGGSVDKFVKARNLSVGNCNDMRELRSEFIVRRFNASRKMS